MTLLLRSVGAIIFGVLSDRYGRKWPLVANLLLIGSLEIGVGFCQDFTTFMALQSLFGVGMGGIWGMAASTALENLPVEFRGIASGVLQQGYAAGYLFAAILNMFLVPKVPVNVGWRVLFYTAAGNSTFSATLRALLPESEVFLRAKAAEREKGGDSKGKSKTFFREIKEMLKTHWLLCIYAVLLMTGFNFLSHGSQDLYPTFLEQSKNFTRHDASIATIISNCAASSRNGSVSEIDDCYSRLARGSFYSPLDFANNFQFSCCWRFLHPVRCPGCGVIPIQLAEMSPPAFRATFPGVSYQLGNMISSASAQIEAVAGEHWKMTIMKDGKRIIVPDYAKVQGLLIGCVAAFVIFITIIGPENHGSHFEAHKTPFEEGAAQDGAVLEDNTLKEVSDSKQIKIERT